MAANYPLKIDQGETFRLSLVYTGPAVDGVELGEPIDLTNASARMQVREGYGKPVLVEITSDENGGITIGGVTGRIDLLLTEAQTDAMGVKEGSTRPRTEAVYDLELVLPSGDVKRVIQGSIVIDPNITRPPSAEDLP